MKWRERAACPGQDPRWWDIDHPALWGLGQAVCIDCPVRIACYRDARGNRHATGLYAGLVLVRGEPIDP